MSMFFRLVAVCLLAVFHTAPAFAQNPYSRTFPPPGGEPKEPVLSPAAVEALLKKAEAGDADAQFNLARHYLTAEKLIFAASDWFSKAAEQGHTGAQMALGLLYTGGVGLHPEDLAEAHKWFNLVGESGAIMRRSVEARMTRAEIADALNRASEWRTKRRSR